jgi:hypothetical protein
LKEVEEHYPLVGSSLVPVYFPGSLRVKEKDDIEFWRKAQEIRIGANKWGVRVDNLPTLEAMEGKRDDIFK